VPIITDRDDGSVSALQETRSPGRRKRAYVIRRVKRETVPTSSPDPESTIAVESHDAPPAGPTALSPEERHRAIAEAAYYRAERRGFQGGDHEQDWWEAAAEIDARIRENDRAD
jgi:hypothetical protein